MEISQLARVLYFHYYEFLLVVLGQYVDTVEFVVPSVLIRFALKKLDNRNFLIKQRGEQAFDH